VRNKDKKQILNLQDLEEIIWRDRGELKRIQGLVELEVQVVEVEARKEPRNPIEKPAKEKPREKENPREKPKLADNKK